MTTELVTLDQRTGELLEASASSAMVQAKVQAAYAIAVSRPRKIASVELKMKADASRPRFARDAEWTLDWAKKKNPITGRWEPAKGPSIRFVESALRAFGNVDVGTRVVLDDETRRVVAVSVTDLESNVSYSLEVSIEKTVERRELKKGQIPISSRTTSTGDTVFVVKADDGTLLRKQRAEESKAVRTLGLRLLPGDIVDEAIDLCHETLTKGDEDDPRAASKKLAGAFYALGITPEELEEYLGHPIEQTRPGEIDELRDVFRAVRDEQASWRELVRARRLEREALEDSAAADEEPSAAPATDPSSRAKRAIKSRAKKAKKKAKKKAEEPTTETAEPAEDAAEPKE